MIACQACGYSNPLGRVFCQKCGTKLDLSRVRPPGSADAKPGEVSVGIRKDEKKPGKKALKWAIRIFDIVLVAAVAFCIYQIWQEPSVRKLTINLGESAKVKDDRGKIEYAIEHQQQVTLQMTDAALNAYLASVSDLGKSSDQGMLRTESLTLFFEKELVNIVYVRKIVIRGWEKRIVLQYKGRPIADGGEFRFQPVHGSIGNLTVPSFAYGIYERNFARLFQNFETERGLLGKLSQIQVEPGKATLDYKPATK